MEPAEYSAKVFSVFDQKAETYMSPVFERNDETARRAFESAVRKGSLQFPEDYLLICIGAFDERTGSLIPNAGYVVAKGREYVVEEE